MSRLAHHCDSRKTTAVQKTLKSVQLTKKAVKSGLFDIDSNKNTAAQWAAVNEKICSLQKAGVIHSTIYDTVDIYRSVQNLVHGYVGFRQDQFTKTLGS